MVNALINLGRERSVDFYENPVLHCMRQENNHDCASLSTSLDYSKATIFE